MRGRLNLFQATMLRWREMHPYSAVHVVRVERPLDAARLRITIAEHLTELGLTGLELDRSGKRFEYKGGATQTALRVHAGVDTPLEIVRREIERELNTPFARDGQFDPFRFFAVAAGGAFYLGLAYDHFVAGGDSIVVLLHGILARYVGAPTKLPAHPYLRYPPTLGHLFLRYPWAAIRGIGGLVELVQSCRRSVRPRYPGGADPHNAFAYCRMEPAQLAALVGTAKAWAVSVNDLLMAILLQVVGPLAGKRVPAHRRHELAAASIVNLRRDLGLDPITTFGQFLSSLRVSHPLPPGISLEQLARDIAAKTARIKRRKLYLQSLIAIGASGVAWRFLSPAERGTYYARNYPVWCGITMLDIDALWAHAGGNLPPPEYLRAVSTGPLSPMVVAVTTAAGVLHAGISYRTTAFSTANIDKITADIIACVKNLTHEPILSRP